MGAEISHRRPSRVPLPMPLIQALEDPGLGGQLVRAVRQGLFFGVETRVPYAITSVLRPVLFAKPSRPLLGSLKWAADQTLQHGWIIARISFLFKLSEWGLMKLSATDKPSQWHTLLAGALAGYAVMVRDGSQATLKRQINMAIGVRTLYAIAAYLVRTGSVPTLNPAEGGYDKGTAIWYTVLWAVVMWHWRHQTAVAPGEMNTAQVRQMDFIYTTGDAPGRGGWFSNNYLPMLLALAAIKWGVPEQSNPAARKRLHTAVSAVAAATASK